MLLLNRFSCVLLIETVINLQDEEGFTPLMWAAAHGQIAVVEFLLQNVCKQLLLPSDLTAFCASLALYSLKYTPLLIYHQ